MLEQLLQYDEQLFIYLNNLGSSKWDNLWLIITNKLTWIPLYAVLLFLIYKKFGIKWMLMIVILVTTMIIITDQLANLFKFGFERPRPCREAHLKELIRYIAPRCGRYGYFSAHAANTTALAVFIGLVLKMPFKKLILLLIFWALIVSYSRIYVGVHYPLDLLSGIFMGGLIGWLFFKISQKFKRLKSV